MRIHDDDYSKRLPERDRWTYIFLGYYALQKIQEKYKSSDKTKLTTGLICNDKRRTNTVRKHLEGLGLVVHDYGENLMPINEAVEKLLPAYTKEPEFNVIGFVKEETYHGSHTGKYIAIKNHGEVYRNIIDLVAQEVIQVYLNQDAYDIKTFKTIYKSSTFYRSDSECFSTRIYPKKFLRQIQDNVVVAQSIQYAQAHAQEILTFLLKTKFKAIDNEKPYTTLADVTERIGKVESKISELTQVLQELQTLQKKISQCGDEAFAKQVQEAGYEYVLAEAPLWVAGEDEDLKKLGLLFLAGSTEVETERTKRR